MVNATLKSYLSEMLQVDGDESCQIYIQKTLLLLAVKT